MPKEPGYRDPGMSANITDNHNIRDGTIYAKGAQVIATLMSNVTDPSVLWQLVQSSGYAKRAFEHRPKSYLKAATARMPKDLIRLASIYIDVAFIEMISEKSINSSEVPEFPDRPYVEDVAYQLFDESYESFQTHPPYPLTALHVLSETHEAIETLQGANIWRVMKTASDTDDSSTIPHRTRKALWYFEIFCAIFYSDQLVQPQPFSRARGLIQDFQSHNELQEYFLGELNWEEINDVVRIWDDLSTMLEMAYRSKLAWLFEAEYASAIKPDGTVRGVDILTGTPLTDETLYQSNTSQSRIVRRAVAKFDNMINYRMSLGVVYLSLIHKSNCPQNMSVDYAIDCNMFFKGVAELLISQEHVINEYRYRLHPINSESRSIARTGVDEVTETSNDGGDPPGLKLEIFYGSSFTRGRVRHMLMDDPVLVGYHAQAKEGTNLDSRGDLD